MRKQLGWGNFRKDFWDCSWPARPQKRSPEIMGHSSAPVSFSFLKWCIYSFHMTSRWPYWCTQLWYGDHVGVQKKSFGDWIHFPCKNFPFVQEICIAADHVNENDLLPTTTESYRYQPSVAWWIEFWCSQECANEFILWLRKIKQ